MTVKRKVVESSLQMSSLSNPSSRPSFKTLRRFRICMNCTSIVLLKFPCEETGQVEKGACILAVKRTRR